METFIKHLEKTGYFEVPASTQYHGNYRFGLLNHSLSVTNLMLEIRPIIEKFFGLTILEESCIIAGLFHDVGKTSYYGEFYYKKTDSNKKPYAINEKLPGIAHEVISLHIVGKFLELTYEESFAILNHASIYSGYANILKGKELPLQQLLHYCDMQESRFGNEQDRIAVPKIKF